MLYNKNTTNFLNEHPVITQANELTSICSPLEKLGITYFSHAHINPQNQFSGLNNSTLFTELYYQKKYFQFDCHQEVAHGEQYLLWDILPLAKETQNMEDDFLACNFGHTFTIMNHNAEGTDCYHFATWLGNESMNGKYLELIEPLKQFINYFKYKVFNNSVLAKAYDFKVPLGFDHAGFYKTQLEIEIHAFKDLIQNDRYYALSGDKYLTSREVESLYWLSQGKTFEETAIILGITARTVKAHIESVKQKTGTQNLFQLGAVYSDFRKHFKQPV